MVWHAVEFIRGVLLNDKNLEKIFQKYREQINLSDEIINQIIEPDSDNSSSEEEEEKKEKSEIKVNLKVTHQGNIKEINLLEIDGYSKEELLNNCVLENKDYVGKNRKTKLGFRRLGHCCDKNNDILIGYFVKKISFDKTRKKSTKLGSMIDIDKDNQILELCKMLEIKNPKIHTYVQANDCKYCS